MRNTLRNTQLPISSSVCSKTLPRQVVFTHRFFHFRFFPRSHRPSVHNRTKHSLHLKFGHSLSLSLSFRLHLCVSLFPTFFLSFPRSLNPSFHLPLFLTSFSISVFLLLSVTSPYLLSPVPYIFESPTLLPLSTVPSSGVKKLQPAVRIRLTRPTAPGSGNDENTIHKM